jgi:diaminopimelate decarboxylase
VTGFFRQGPELVCDGVPLDAIAATHATPLYVYSAAAIAERYRAIDDAFAGHPHAIHYALKANSTLAITRLLRSLGSHADANSGGEIDVALRAGFLPSQIVFTGVGKTAAELAQAIDLGVRSINVESRGEIERIDTLSRARHVRTRIAIRVNPDVDAKTHPHISTGLKINKFGIPSADVVEVCAMARGRANIEVVGLHAHVGSQITSMEPLARAARALVDLARALAAQGTSIEHLDIGGGLGVSYDGAPVPGVTDYAAAVLPILKESGLAVVLEPGRHIMAPAGVLLTSVVDVKGAFVVMDAGMTELIRPMMYNAFHRIEPVRQTDAPASAFHIVGPLCESSDTLGRDRTIPVPCVGDVFAVMDAGAYGSVMASNYNRRMFPAEVLVENGAARVIRRRQSLEDVLALEF